MCEIIWGRLAVSESLINTARRGFHTNTTALFLGPFSYISGGFDFTVLKIFRDCRVTNCGFLAINILNFFTTSSIDILLFSLGYFLNICVEKFSST
jgi:hypothetical protein